MANQQGGERTEKPTTKKVKDARERGQVARSRDLSSALSLLGVAITLSWIGSSAVTAMRGQLADGITSIGEHARLAMDPAALANLMWRDAGVLVSIAGPAALAAAAVSIGTSVAQTGWSYSPKALALNWSRLSPKTGFARFSPLQAGPELLKGILGATAIGVLCYWFVRDVYTEAPQIMNMAPSAAGALGWNRLWTLLWRSSLAFAVFGAADYGFQRYRWFTQLKMTRQEVRDESKLHDGSPEIKARVRKVQREMTRRRMLQSVKTATVVITNPTHFAVALEYRRLEMQAPVVVAKGQDELAQRIRTVAREHGVPIVENVTLARALHKAANVGDAIPAELFGAVAEVLAYLVRLKQLLL